MKSLDHVEKRPTNPRPSSLYPFHSQARYIEYESVRRFAAINLCESISLNLSTVVMLQSTLVVTNGIMRLQQYTGAKGTYPAVGIAV